MLLLPEEETAWNPTAVAAGDGVIRPATGAATARKNGMRQPHFGFTRHGHPVHLRTIDYHRADTAYQNLNKKVATAVTRKVASMTCAYLFSLLALVSLPAILTQGFHLHVFPAWLISAGLIALVAWIAQTYIQLVLLSVIMVGQDVASQASDARAAKTFEDTELVVDRLDTNTEGGLQEVMAAIKQLEEKLPGR